MPRRNSPGGDANAVHANADAVGAPQVDAVGAPHIDPQDDEVCAFASHIHITCSQCLLPFANKKPLLPANTQHSLAAHT